MLNNVLVRPVITERSMKDAAAGRFTFAVVKEADKGQIAQAARELFGINVVGVRTVAVPAREHRAGRMRQKAVKSAWKKAIIQLKPGEKIDLFEVGEAKNA